jgi:hypothetical protein
MESLINPEAMPQLCSCEPAAGEAQACRSLTKETIERDHALELGKRFET